MTTNWFDLATHILYGHGRGAKAMLTAEQELQSRSGCDDSPVPCANCGHLDFEHDPDTLRCRVYEQNPESLLYKRCDCRRFEPLDSTDILETED